MTKQQRHLLRQNPHLIPLAVMEDNDILVLDTLPAQLSFLPNGEIRKPLWILTRAGCVQEIAFHAQTNEHSEEERHADMVREHLAN
jgi:hypothetical protein